MAEGVESPAQLAQLRALGCRYGQGHLWSPGLRAEDFAGWFVRQAARTGTGTGTG